MILVDTSVLVNYLRGGTEPRTRIFDEVLKRNMPFGISPYTYQEVLQGALNQKEYGELEAYLSSQTLYYLPDGLGSFKRAAYMFFLLRRKGVTIRSTIDILIALTAMHHGLALLHDDADFDRISAHISGLEVLQAL